MQYPIRLLKQSAIYNEIMRNEKSRLLQSDLVAHRRIELLFQG